MEASPLVQQARPSFQPKITHLYEKLFNDHDESALSDGFWSEFFLLKPDKTSLRRRLDYVGADDLLHFQNETQELFVHAVKQIKSGIPPTDEVAFDNLTVFLAGVLAKRYTNPSSEIITVLAGLHQVDAVFSDLANAIETTIRSGRSLDIRKKAVQTALSLTSGAYQTSLVSYFTHRDLFPALMKYVQDCEQNSNTFEAFLLLGLLANYNKFEYRNPYRIRLEDFVNESVIQKVVHGLGISCSTSRDQYAAIIDDVPEGWTLSSTLTYIGLGVLAPIKAFSPITISTDKADEQFSALPSPEAAILLSTYDFAHANKLFCYNLIICSSESKSQETPFSAFLSLTSYILHHASRSSRASLYGILTLTIIRLLIEDPSLSKRLTDSSSGIRIRLARQRPPYLPLTTSPRPPVASILDIATDTINHNLRRRLDLDIYTAATGLIHRILSYLGGTHTHFEYHWSHLWASLLNLVRFLVTYSTDLLAQSSDPQTLLEPLLKTVALAITSGSAFLPDPGALDDLSYKLVEQASTLTKLKTAYKLADGGPIDILIVVAEHYQQLLVGEKERGRLGRSAGPREVARVIREGFEGLQLPEVEGLGLWKPWREGEERGFVKRVARLAVEDARKWVGTL